jgi:hypothetical protein
VSGSLESNLTLRALIIAFLVAFGFYLAADLGLVRRGLGADQSRLSLVILALYVGATLHWLWLAHRLAADRRQMAKLEASQDAPEDWPSAGQGTLGDLIGNLRKKAKGDSSVLIGALGDDLANRHALGHFLSDVLLKLGLLGTVVGFILMLIPLGEAGGFDAALMPRLLGAMSSGMSVALYTTFAGLVTSTLLKAQYYMLDASLAQFVNRLTVFVDVHVGSDAS